MGPGAGGPYPRRSERSTTGRMAGRRPEPRPLAAGAGPAGGRSRAGWRPARAIALARRRTIAPCARCEVALVQLEARDDVDGEHHARRRARAPRPPTAPTSSILPEYVAVPWLRRRVPRLRPPIPGPTTEPFAAVARETGTWILAGIARRGVGRSGPAVQHGRPARPLGVDGRDLPQAPPVRRRRGRRPVGHRVARG